jgi:hypothetical protein
VEGREEGKEESLDGEELRIERRLGIVLNSCGSPEGQ